MNEFKENDLVMVYAVMPPEKGIVTRVFADKIYVNFPGKSLVSNEFHKKACRKLKPKAKPREVWIIEYEDDKETVLGGCTYSSEEEAKNFLGSYAKRTIRFREVRK